MIAVRTDATAHVSGECVRALKFLVPDRFARALVALGLFVAKGHSSAIQRSTSRFQGPASIVQTFTAVKLVSPDKQEPFNDQKLSVGSMLNLATKQKAGLYPIGFDVETEQ